MTDKLQAITKPCPFCGGLELYTANHVTGWMVQCDRCHAHGPMAATAASAREAWTKALATQDSDVALPIWGQAIERMSTHYDGCWRYSPRHWQCAVAEAEYQRTRAEMAEAELLSTLQLVDRYGAWMSKTSKPVPFAEWLRRLQGLADLIENTEVQP